MSDISSIHTPCKNCTFALYKDKTQVGCALNKIELFRKHGKEIIEAYDEEKEFYVINNAICISKRGPIFEEKNKGKNLVDIVLEETRLKYMAIIFYDLFTSIDDLKERLTELSNQKIGPCNIQIINKVDSNFIKLRNELIPYAKCDISIQTILDKDLSDRQIIDLCVDRTFYNPHTMYVTINGNEKINYDVSIIQEKIEAGIPILIVENGNSIHMNLVNKVYHRKHGGNAFGITLKAKLLEFEKGSDKFIYQWNKL